MQSWSLLAELDTLRLDGGYGEAAEDAKEATEADEAEEAKEAEAAEESEPEGVGADTYVGERFDDGLNKCAICLDTILLEETAELKGCEHQYCICCILQWATYHADAPRCPQCKSYFNYIYLYKNLDGSLNDYLQEESVTLLMRARWFNGKAPAKEEEEPLDYYDDDDCEEEDFYFRTHRVVLGNRRWGAGGFVGNGRQQARAVHSSGASSSSSGASTSVAGSSKSANKERSAVPPLPSKKAAERAAKAAAKASKETARKDAAKNSRGKAAAAPHAPASGGLSAGGALSVSPAAAAAEVPAAVAQ